MAVSDTVVDVPIEALESDAALVASGTVMAMVSSRRSATSST